MAELSTSRRKKLKKTTFGIPSQRKYPMPDKSHAANAKARAKQQLNQHKISRSTYNSIVSKANRVLGSSRKKKS